MRALTLSVRAAALVFVAVLVAACGPGAKERTIKTTLTGVNAARAAFVAWDDRAQNEIVDKATSMAEGQAALEEHRRRRVTLVTAFEGAYRAIALAAVDPSDLNVAEVVAAAATLWQVYKEITGGDVPRSE